MLREAYSFSDIDNAVIHSKVLIFDMFKNFMHQKEGSYQDRVNEILARYNINLKKLEEEQEKLARAIKLEDEFDFELAGRIAGIESVFLGNKIISAIVVLDEDCEIIEQEYAEEKMNFPYIPEFRAYRELPAMIQAFNKLDEKPDLVFIRGHGILHPRGLGLASHFSIVAGVPSIGIADSLIAGEEKNNDIILNGKVAGRKLETKEGSNPIFVSPGNLISLSTSVELVKKFTREPHKIPEPLRLARRYAKEIMHELYNN